MEINTALIRLRITIPIGFPSELPLKLFEYFHLEN